MRKDVNELLQAADVMVFPSLFEGLGIAVVEAQCTGMPCIISDIIPNEVMITDLVEKVSLRESASTWAEKLIAATTRTFDRPAYAEKVASAGYDIKSNSRWMFGKHHILWQH